jgi:hypothetical protein
MTQRFQALGQYHFLCLLRIGAGEKRLPCSLGQALPLDVDREHESA